MNPKCSWLELTRSILEVQFRHELLTCGLCIPHFTGQPTYQDTLFYLLDIYYKHICQSYHSPSAHELGFSGQRENERAIM